MISIFTTLRCSACGWLCLRQASSCSRVAGYHLGLQPASQEARPFAGGSGYATWKSVSEVFFKPSWPADGYQFACSGLASSRPALGYQFACSGLVSRPMQMAAYALGPFGWGPQAKEVEMSISLGAPVRPAAG